MELRRRGKKNLSFLPLLEIRIAEVFSSVSSETFAPVRCDSVIAYDRKVERVGEGSQTKVKQNKAQTHNKLPV